MSEDQVHGDADGQMSGETANRETVDVNELMERLEKLESYNEKLINETKQWRTKYKSVRDKVEEVETEKLKQTDNFKGLYEKESERVASLQNELHNIRRSNMKTSLKFEVAKHAKDAKDIDDVIAAINRTPGLIAYDDEIGEFKGIEDAVGLVRQEKKYLFNENRTGFVNGRPQGVPTKNLQERLKEDPESVWEEALRGAKFI